MKIDIEKMRVAVLAECEILCPNDGDGHKGTVKSGTIIHSKDQAWVWLDGLGSRIYINKNMSIAVANAMYAIIGLSEREAVETERSRLLKRYKARIKRLRANDAETHRIQIEVKDERIAKLEAKNAVLVAALEDMYLAYGTTVKIGQLNGLRTVQTNIGRDIKHALAANEKGGAND